MLEYPKMLYCKGSYLIVEDAEGEAAARKDGWGEQEGATPPEAFEPIPGEGVDEGAFGDEEED